ncbi:hypothetical protein [Allopontixanthobacter sp.]|uniref:hypothetical protein n=1 Tax=Allopontixanthobacter sp. TaxID=2906452 RepID=UPI002AB8461F|nr:hypothetical protein [Allopontixanthobacter sp.]MDZ4307441.1 hypothetical protein [Allopontixanthobacter sp.]
MARTKDRPKSQPLPYKRLAIFMAVALVPAFFAADHAMQSVLRARSPATILIRDPQDPVASVTLAQVKLLENPQDDAVRENAAAVARASLRKSPVNPAALRLLAYTEPADSPEAEQFVDLAIRYSRRDELAQLFKALKVAERGEERQALKHFDTAMRTSRASRQLLYPVLGNALANTEMRRSFAYFFENEPEWLPGFLHYLISETPSPRNAGLLISTAENYPNNDIYRALKLQLTERLVATDDMELARALLRRTASVDPKVSVSPSLTPSLVDEGNGAYAWRMFGGASIGAALVSAQGSGTAMEIFATSAESDVVATKLLFLSPGNYRLIVQASSRRIPEGSSIGWTVACQSGGNWAERTSVQVTPRNNPDTLAMTFSVPRGCRAQRIAVSATGSSGIDDLEATIAAIELTGGS